MVTENGVQGDGNTSFLRAARAGNLERVLEHLKNNIDINTSNANGLNALHLASKDGHIHVVSELLRRGAIVDSATKKGNTALHIASLAGQEEVVKLLLEHNASVNVQSQNGFTPLYMAAQENHDAVVRLLLSNGANQSLATEDGFTPLAVAMQQGHDKVVAVLLESDTRGKVRLPALHIAAKKDDVKAATLLLDNDHNPDVTSKSGFTPLHIASHYGNQNIANLLIQKGADVNYSAKHNISPLHVAAKWGKTNMVSLLLEKGGNIEAKTRDGLTPLHCAARSGHEQVVDMLLERGAPISAKTKNGLAPLHMAAQGEHVDAARILLYHRAPVDEVTVDYLTALHVAAHCGHVRVAKLLLDRNADANARALNGFTPLHIACKKNRLKVVELLLRHGASISATTESGLTPLHVAAFMGCMNIVIYLLQHDASPDVPTVRGETPLHLAARANQTDIIRILLRNGAQVDARAREQQTPLHIASRLGNVDIVMLLLQHGAQVDATTKDMYTALHIAAKEGQDEVAAVLIENGAALDAATKKGFTPLHLTAKYGHIKVAQLLLQKEADVDAQGKNGVTPLHVACHYNNQQVALLLLEKGASPHATAKNGHTPLHIAARKNQMDIATTLLEYGAQANAESKAGFTPLHLSSQEGHAEISNLLIEHKAAVNHPAKNGLTPMHLCAQEDNVNVAEILQRNGANIDMATKAGYTPLHVASHFGQANMVRFLLQNGANIDMATKAGYTPLHQTAQQGHCHIVNLLLEHKANANAQTVNGQTPLHIARKLGYISVLDSLKSITKEDEAAAAPAQAEEKYRVVAPEAMHESFMSDSEEEGGEDNMLSDQPYRYLTVDEMKSLGDDSLPIDVTRDERMDSNRMTQSAEYASGVPPTIGEEMISPHKAQVYGSSPKATVDGVYIANGNGNDEPPHVGRKLSWKSFLVSFLVDARGGAMRGCRHSGVRMIIPSRSTCQPTRVTCRYVKPQRTMHPPQLMEGEALASRVLELGPCSTKFIGPVVMEVPHFASLRGKEREIIILRSDNGETWREHTIDNSEEIIHDVMQQCFEPEEIAQLEEQAGNHVCRFVTYDFPQYFAVVSRIRQEVHAIGPEGGMVSSTVVPQVQAVFPQGALTKKIKVGLQAQPVDPDLTAKLLGRGVAVSPIVTVEPRRRKFHKAITLSMPAPKAHSQGMINQYSGNTPTLRLLCSITGGPSRAQWEDVTGSTPLTFVNDCVSFTTTVSARFWLMDCRNISDATKMATELYKEVIHVPFIARFVVFAKKIEPFEARLRVFCMTDDREDKTLEKHELYTEVAKSRDVEVLEGKPQYIEMAGNLVPVTKSGDQLQLQFKAFRENRLPFTVRVKDQHADIVGRTLFMKEPKVAKGEQPQQPICILNIMLPEAVIPDSTTAFSERVTSAYRTSMFSLSKHQNDHYIGDIRIVDLSNLLGKDWILLAPEIGITPDEIDEIINHNTGSIARQAQSMIRLYKDKPNYDILALETALKNIGRDDIMKKCKSGRLSHSREFDEADLMKNSESVEELVRRESKRIQQINEREEVKYSAEEKEIEESESDEEQAKRTVAERREKIVKRLSMERSIPASTQKKEITREITEIKRKSLIEDKKAHHESEILMQLPADNVIIKTAAVPEQVIKMKMGKLDSTEVSKTDFDKELTHKLRTSGRSSEEEEQSSPDKVDKIIQDISTAEKTLKDTATTSRMASITRQEAKDMTEDFLEFERRSQLPAETTTTTVHEKFVEEFKEKTSPMSTMPQETIKEVEQVISEVTETASKKVENIISSFESGKQEIQEKTTEIVSETTKVSETIKHLQDTQSTSTDQAAKTVEIVESTIDEKIADFEAKKVKYDFHGGEPKTQIPKLVKKSSDEPLKPTAAPRAMAETEFEKPAEAKLEKPLSKIPVKSGAEVDARKLTHDFLQSEQKTQLEPKTAPTASKIPKVEPRKTLEKEIKVVEDVIESTATTMTSEVVTEMPREQPDIFAKADVVTEKLHDLIDTFHTIEDKVKKIKKPGEMELEKTLVSAEQEQPKDDKVAEKIANVVETFHKIEEKIVLDSHKQTHDFLSMEQQSQLPSMPQTSEKIVMSSQTSATSEPESVISVVPASPASKIPQPSQTSELESATSGKSASPASKIPQPSTAAETESVISVKSSSTASKIPQPSATSEAESLASVTPASPASKIPQLAHQASKIPVVEPRKSLVEETIKTTPQKVQPLNERQLTEDFLNMEQKTQLQSQPMKGTVTELIAATASIETTIVPEVLQPKEAAEEPSVIVKVDAKATELEVESKLVASDGIESAAPIGEVSPFATRKLTADFLAMEQQTQLPGEYESDIFGEGLTAPLSIEPRKSLTDAEFCKYVGDTITKKMSEGLIEMTDELKQIASDIPDSQTPPPTPSDAKTEKQNEQPDIGRLERDYLGDTVTTLHSTTESTFERVSAISTIAGGQKESPDMEEVQQDAGDREYLEQIMGCGDVRRKILRLESSGSTESLESSNVAPKYIGDNVPVVKEVVQSIEDKICNTVVSAIPFAIQKREKDQMEPNVFELEKQILTDADIALEKLTKCEPPTEVVQLSPIQAMERGAVGIAHIKEEVCEKVCEKRKAFEVAEDLSETQKTLAEQVIGLDRQVKQVPGKILTASIDEHKDLVSKDTEVETLPKVKEVVQDIERRYPSTILEVTPFSPREKSLQMIDDILKPTSNIKSPINLEEKPKTPVDASMQIPNDNESEDEEGFEKPESNLLRCTKSLIPTMMTTTKITFASKSRESFDIQIKEVVKLPTEPIKSVEKPKSPTDFTKPIPKEFSDEESDDEFGIAKPQDKTTPSTASQLSIGDKSLKKVDDILKPTADDKLPFTLDKKPKSPVEANKQIPKKYSDDDSEDEVGFEKPVGKRLSSTTPVIPATTTTSTITSVSESSESVDVQIKDVVKPPTDPIKSAEKPKSPTDFTKPIPKEFSAEESDDDFGIVKPQDKLPQTTPSTASQPLIGEKALQKVGDILKPTADDKLPIKLDEKPKSPVEANKQIAKEYSDDESEEEVGFDKPVGKSLPSATPLIPTTTTTSKITSVSESRETVVIQIKDVVKLPTEPIKSVEKPKSPTDFTKPIPKEFSDEESDDEFGITKPQYKTTPSTASQLSLGDKSLQKVGDILKPTADDKLPTTLDKKPKSPVEANKLIPKEYSDDESEDEVGFDKPVGKPLTSTTTVIPVTTTTNTVTSVSESRESVGIQIKDVVKLPTEPIKSVEKPKSPTDFIREEFSDEESDDEFGYVKTQHKLPQTTPSTASQLPIVEKFLQNVDAILKPTADDKLPIKLDEKPKSPVEANKLIPKEYSDDESEDEVGFDKPVGKPLSSTTTVIPVTTTTSTVTSVSESRESVGIQIKDIVKLPTEPIESVEKPKSPTAFIRKEFSDEESDDEFGIVKTQDKLPQTTPSTASQLPIVEKSLEKVDVILKPTADDKLPIKFDEKPKSPVTANKLIPKEYSDDESEDEVGFEKHVGKSLPSSTPLKPATTTTSTITSVSESRESVDIHIKDVVKLPTDPIKSAEKPKSPTDFTKPIPKEFSDEESDDEFGIVKPQDKLPQTTPSTASQLPIGDKSLQNVDDILKPTADDKLPIKLDEKPKSPVEANKQIPKEYSDDESEDEVGFDKPVGKSLPSTTPVIPATTTTSTITSVSESKETVDIQIKNVVKLPTEPIISAEKPKSPTDFIRKEFSDEETDDEFGIVKPQDKLPQTTPSTASQLSIGDKSLQKVDDILKPTADDKLPIKLDEKPKSPVAANKQILKEYSDDESEDEYGFDKPVGKPLPFTTPLIPATRTTSKITSLSIGDKSLQKVDDILKPTADDKLPIKLDEKPKSPVEANKQIPKEYSDDESEDEVGIDKPVGKPLSSTTPVIPATTTTSTITSLPIGEKSLEKVDDILKPTADDKVPVKLDEKPKSPVGANKQIPKEYSDDESEDEVGFDKPVGKSLPSTTPVIPATTTTSTITSVSESKETVDIQIKNVVKLPTEPIISAEKPKSPTDFIRKEFSDEETDDEFGIVKPQDKLPQTTPSTASQLSIGDKSLQKVDDILKPTADDKLPIKLDEKPKSPVAANKQILKEYSDDESEDEYGFDKPVGKPLPFTTPLIPATTTTSTITSVSESRESVGIQIKDIVKLPTEPIKSVEKPKSPTDFIRKEFSDEESDDEFGIVKTQDKLPQTTPSTASQLPLGEKSLEKVDDILKPTADDKLPVKLDEKRKSPVEANKLIPKEYSDDESEDEVGFDKPVGEPLPFTTPLIPATTTTSTITSVSESRESVGIQIKDIVKLPTEPIKSVEKPKSPTDFIRKEFSDEESDDEFGIVKTQDKLPQTTPSTASQLPLGEKSLEKVDDILKPTADDKLPVKLDEKRKSPVEANKLIPKEYSDDESEDEVGFDKPAGKSLPFTTLLIPTTTTTSKITSLSIGEKSLQKVDDILKPTADDKLPIKLDEKPKSPVETNKQIPKEYSDDESEDEVGFNKPVGKSLPSTTPLIPATTTTSKITSLFIGEKSLQKVDDILKPTADDKLPIKLDEKPKTPVEANKQIPKEYSDDESEGEVGLDNTVGKPLPSTTPVIPTTATTSKITSLSIGDKSLQKVDDILKPTADDKLPIKLDEKPKSPIEANKQIPKEYSDDESEDEVGFDKPVGKSLPSTTPLIPTTTTTSKITSLPIGDKSLQNVDDILKPTADDKLPIKLDEKPKSPVEANKQIPKEYSDDESEDEVGFDKPVGKSLPSTTPLIPTTTTTSKITSLPIGDKSLQNVNDILKPTADDKLPIKLDEKPKSPVEANKQIPKEYSDDESEDEVGFDKPVGKSLPSTTPLIPTTRTTSKITSLPIGDKSLQNVDDILKPTADDKLPIKLDEKPKSPVEANKQIPKEYSDDESEDEVGFDKPVGKSLPSTTPLIPTTRTTSKITSLSIGDKSLQKVDDILKPTADDKLPIKLDEKPKSPIEANKQIPKEYSDDESEDEVGFDKPVGKSLPSTTPLIPTTTTTSKITSLPIGDKSLQKVDDILKPTADDKLPIKLDEKPKSPVETNKQIPKEYSDDESEDEVGFNKPLGKSLPSTTPLIPATTTTSKITSVSESREIVDVQIKDLVKLPTEPIKSVEKPKSTTDFTKTIPKEFSDEESDDEFGVKPQDKLPQTSPSTASQLFIGEKSLQKVDDILKPTADDKLPIKLDEKPKTPVEANKQIPKEYSDDESEGEVGLDNTVGKPLPSTTPVIPTTATTSKITSLPIGDKSLQKVDDILKPTADDKLPIKLDEKPKSPIEANKQIAKEYSDDESEDEVGFDKPVGKSLPSTTPLIPTTRTTSKITSLPIGDKSLQKVDDILKPTADDKLPIKLDEKPKSSVEANKQIPKEYSDDESEDEVGFDKPVGKSLPSTTPLIPTTTTTSKITSLSIGDKSLQKVDDILKPTADDKLPIKLDEKPKSPVEANKQIPKEYSDDESEDEVGFDKPVGKSLPSTTPLIPTTTTTSKITSLPIGDKSLQKVDDILKPTADDKLPIKLDEKPKSPVEANKQIPKEYSDDESEDEVGFDKPVGKSLPSTTPLIPTTTTTSKITSLSIGDKSLQKVDDILKPTADDKLPIKLDEKPKSPVEANKQIPKEYSDDESEDEVGFDKPVGKSLPSTTPLIPTTTTTSKITSLFIGEKSLQKVDDILKPTADDKLPIKLDEKPKTPVEANKQIPKEYSDDESEDEVGFDKPVGKSLPSTTPLIPTTTTTSKITSLPIGDKSLQKVDDILKPTADDKLPIKLDENSKTPVEANKQIPKEYSDDESEGEVGLDNTVGKPLPSTTPVIPTTATTIKITSLPIGDKSLQKVDDILKPTADDKLPIKLDEKPKSPVEANKQIPKEYSDDESEDEVGFDKPVGKSLPSTTPLIPTTTTTSKITSLSIGDKSLQKVDDILKPTADDKLPIKLDEKPKSPVEANKQIPKEYSDDESEDEVGFDKPVGKSLPSTTPLIPTTTTTSKITSLPIGDKSLQKVDDILKPTADDKLPIKLDEKPKSPVEANKQIPKEYSDDESEDEVLFDKPVGKSLPSTTPLIPTTTTTSKITSLSIGDKSLQKVDDILKPTADDKLPIKLDEKPKSPVEANKQIPKEYSDDESEDEVGFDKPVGKSLPSTTPLIPTTTTTSKITSLSIGDKSLQKVDDILKPTADDKLPIKLDEKPKSPVEANKQIPKEYSDDESEDEVGFDKPVGKSLPSTTPLIPTTTTTSKITSLPIGDKSLQNVDDILKPTADDKLPIKLDEKPTSPVEANKQIPKEYSDDESEDEVGFDKPVGKSLPSTTPLIPTTTTTSKITSLPIGDKSLQKVDDILKPTADDKLPIKLDEKPKSPVEANKQIPKEYSDDESEDEVGFDKPVGKSLPSTTPLIPATTTTSKITSLSIGDKSLQKVDDILKPTADDKLPIKLDEKPKSPVEANKQIPKEYSDDESEDAVGFDKPVGKSLPSTTPLIPTTRTTSKITSLPIGDKSLQKVDDILKPTADDKLPIKLDEKPKSPVEANKQIPKEYSDDESEDEVGFDKPVGKSLPSTTPLIPTTRTTSKITSLPIGDKSLQNVDDILKPTADDKLPIKLDEKPKSPVEANKQIPKEYSDDESEDEVGFDKPVGKSLPSTTPLIPTTRTTSKFTSLPIGDKSLQKVDDILKPTADDKLPIKLDEKPKSPVEANKQIPKEYSDDESEGEVGLDNTVGKPLPSTTPVIPTTATTSKITSLPIGDKSLQKVDDILKPTADDKLPIKLDEKPKSPVEANKQIPKEYSDDESGDEVGFDKPVGKSLPSTTPLKPTTRTTSKFTSLPIGDKSLQNVDDILKPTADDKLPIKLDEKPKSPVEANKQIPKEYSDDESEDEVGFDKPVGKSLPSTTPLIPTTRTTSKFTSLPIGDKSLQNVDDILKPTADDKLPIKLDEKPKSPVEANKQIPKEYSDDESEDEVGFDKPVGKSLPSTTPLIPTTRTTSKFTSLPIGDKSLQKVDDILKPTADDKLPIKLDEKPKSPVEANKQIPKEYSDDESEGEVGLDNTVGKPLPSTTPVIPTTATTSKITSLSIGDKSLQKVDDILKPTADDKLPIKLDEKPKSPVEANKQIPKEYSDDESEDEVGFDKPVGKSLPSTTPLIPTTTTTSKITSLPIGDKSLQNVDDILKPTADDKLPIKLDEKPKSPVEANKQIPKEYSDDESEDEVGFDKPVGKSLPSTTPLIPTTRTTSKITSLPIGDKSLQKVDDILKPTADDKLPIKLDEKPKSPVEANKKIPKEYSDDESEDEVGFDKPVGKSLPSTTPLIPTTTTTSKITSLSIGDKSLQKVDDILKPTADDKLPIKLDEKPKSPVEANKQIPKEYSDDESEDEVGFDKPVGKSLPSATPLIPTTTTTSKITSLPIGDKSLQKVDDILKPTADDKLPIKLDEKPKSPVEANKQIPKEYSDDESEDEVGFDKPVGKSLPSATPLIPTTTTTSKITSLSIGDKSLQKVDDILKPTADDKLPIKLDEKPKSLVEANKQIPKEYSDDESEDEVGFDKPVGKSLPSATPLIPTTTTTSKITSLSIGDKSLQKVDDILKPTADDKLPIKLDEKPKSLVEANKQIPKEYSDDESEDEVGFDKPVGKSLPSATPLIPTTTTTSKITSLPIGDKSLQKVDDILKPTADDKLPIKLDEKPKSPVEANKQIPKEYSDDESEGELPIGEKSLQKVDDILKPTADDKLPINLDEKPKSPVEANKQIPKDYSDDESEDEVGFDKPVGKSLPSATPRIPTTTTTSKITSVSESREIVDVQIKDLVKLPTEPIKSVEKPKSPTDFTKPIPKEFSDEDNDEEDKLPQTTFSTASQLPIGEKSLQKVDDILKPTAEDKLSFKLDEKPKSPVEANKQIPKEYSDDENEKEVGFDKSVGYPFNCFSAPNRSKILANDEG
ncbi:hypothetical protein ACLKA7_016539 [Drosophila subpalustris]